MIDSSSDIFRESQESTFKLFLQKVVRNVYNVYFGMRGLYDQPGIKVLQLFCSLPSFLSFFQRFYLQFSLYELFIFLSKEM